jgi:hypothetical protein
VIRRHDKATFEQTLGRQDAKPLAYYSVDRDKLAEAMLSFE